MAPERTVLMFVTGSVITKVFARKIREDNHLAVAEEVSPENIALKNQNLLTLQAVLRHL